MYEEFPHRVEIYRVGESVENDSGGFDEGKPILFTSLHAFIDTPTAFERYTAMQSKALFDCYMYYPYRTDLTNSMQVCYEGIYYDMVSKPMDQGGQHEIMRVQLLEVTK